VPDQEAAPQPISNTTSLPMPLTKRIVGYCDPLSAAPGEEVSFFVSCDPVITEFRAELVMPRAGGRGWEETGPSCTVVPADFAGSYPARYQEMYPGSHVEVPGGGRACGSDGPVTLAVLVQPSCQPHTDQVLVSCGDPWAGAGFALILDQNLQPAMVTPDGRGGAVALSPESPLPVGRWSTVVATLDDAGCPASADLVFGAARSPGSRQARLAFTGRMESPVLLAGRVPPADAAALISAGPAASDPAQTSLAWWDFSEGISGWTARDRGPSGLHGTLRNLPMRGVRGSRWDGVTTNWTEVPEQYAALHFLADALEDCAWQPAFTFRVPGDARSGFYAARLTAGADVEYIPFFIRPPEGAAAQVLLIAPTATYASYGNSRFWWENPIQEMVQDRLVELGPEEQFLLAHPEIGASSYDCHLDGTDICYVSRRRPNLNMRPGHVRREGYTCDLYLVAWLDHIGADYHVATDEDLHFSGRALLDRYPVVLTGSHPEYMSEAMFDACDQYTASGGRLMYLGGNGFSMNITFHPERPWIMENRRVDLWERPEEFGRTEARNSTDGEPGGFFRSSGRSTAALIGVESATMGFDHSYPYTLGPGASRPEASFVFAGVDPDVLADGKIGDFGLLGGGVVGQEWDNSATFALGPGHLILASSADHTLVPPLFGAVRPDYHADLVLFFRGTGAVFSVSSMAWCGALSHHDYQNEIAVITGNVLARFLDAEPFPSLAPSPDPGGAA
jgi:N,N-dimethylformamidase beta subunit-like, C-terminal